MPVFYQSAENPIQDESIGFMQLGSLIGFAGTEEVLLSDLFFEQRSRTQELSTGP